MNIDPRIASDSPRRRLSAGSRVAIQFACLLCVLLILYAPSLKGGFLWDDLAHVFVERPEFYSWHGLGMLWIRQGFTQQYYPLTFTTIWVAHHLWGIHPFGYRLLTLILHALNAAVLFALLTELELPAAAWAAWLFALHPMEVESVAWVSEIKNTQSAFFYLISLFWYLRFVRSNEQRASAYGVSFLFYGAALLSKTVSCSLPAVALLLVWYERGRLKWKDVLWLIPYFVLGLSLGLHTARVEKFLIGAVGPAWDFSLSERVRIAGHAFWFYVGKLIWPHPLLFIYPLWNIHTFYWRDALYPAAVVIGFVLLATQRRRWGNGPLVAFLMFGAIIFPALGFFNLYPMRYAFVADHFQYLAGIPLIVLFAEGLRRAGRRLKMPGTSRNVVAILLCGVLAFLTWKQARPYRNSQRLWRDVLAKDPDSLVANINLANELMMHDAVDEARPMISKLARLRPDDVNVQLTLGHLRLHFDNDPRAALPAFLQAKEIVNGWPPSHAADGLRFFIDELLGDTYFDLRQTLLAQQAYRAALSESAPLHAQAYFDTTPQVLARLESDIDDRLGQLDAQDGNFTNAITEDRRAVQLRPEVLVYRLHLAQALAKDHQSVEAQTLCQQMINENPDAWEVHQLLGELLVQEGQPEKAVDQYQQAIDLNPDLADVRAHLGVLLLNLHRRDEAIAVFSAGIRHTEKPQKASTPAKDFNSFLLK